MKSGRFLFACGIQCAIFSISVQNGRGQATYYTDFAPSGPGFGTNPDFLWDTTFAAFWTTDPTGNAPATPWTNTSPPSNAVLGTGSGIGSHSATFIENISVGTISTVNGTWSILLGTHTLTIESSTNSTLGVAISGSGGLIKSGSSTLTVGSVNNFSGGTTINGGTLALTNTNASIGPVTINSGGTLAYADSAALPNSTALTLAGGTLSLSGAYSPAFIPPLGLLASSTLNFGSGLGASGIAFGDSSGQSWTGTLTILNYSTGSDTLRFGSSNLHLSGAQVAAINFGGIAAQIDSNGFVTPVPEPSMYAALIGIGALAFVALRRRQARLETAS